MSGSAIDVASLRDHLFAGSPLVAVARGVSWQDLEASTAALLDAGFPAIEVTLDAPDALDNIARLRKHFAGELAVGAGTVATAEAAMRAVDAGASFLVAAALDVEIVRWATKEHVPMLPGVVTPTEMQTALNLGAPAVKLFPAGPLGPEYLRVLRGPMPHAAIVPTGGISPAEVAGWLEAGAMAVGLGGALFGRSAQRIATLLTDLAVRLEPWTKP